jgi:hypothetical protein|tara:strand:+ start:108 stop:383 length:276 start_codon:yes stop_codon:yes gene_type:complete
MLLKLACCQNPEKAKIRNTMYARTATIKIPIPVTLAIAWNSCQVGFLAITRTLLAEDRNLDRFSSTFITNTFHLLNKIKKRGKEEKGYYLA